MVWPIDDLTSAHLDAGTDDPKQARPELLAHINKFKTVLGDPAITEVATIAALKALAIPASAVAVNVQGYTARGDGKGGIFWWDSASAEADNGGTVIIPDSAPANGRWKRFFTGKQINVLWFGVVADGTTDDLAKILNAEGAAFSMGGTLIFPPGYTYAFNGRLGLRVSAFGYGATLKPLSTTTYDTLSNFHVVSSTQSDDLIFAGFAINGNAKCRGAYIEGGHRCTLRDIRVTNAMAGGITVFNSDDVTVDRCDISGVIYEGTFIAADGIYFGGCGRPRALYNRIADFKRIGIVTESVGAAKSSGVRIIGNHISNSHDCDESASEFNAGIWCENTNGGVIAYNRIWDIGDNTGQTSNRVLGIIAAAVGEDKDNIASVIDNYIEIGEDAGNRIGKCITISGSNNLTHVIVRGNHLKNANVGIECGPGIKSVDIDGTFFDNLRVTAGSHGCVLVAGGASPSNLIRVANIKFKGIDDADVSNDWTHVHVFDGAPLVLRIENCFDIGLAMRAAGTDVFIDNSRILTGTDSGFKTINTTRNVFVTGTGIEPRAGRSNTNFNVSEQGALRIQNSILHNITMTFFVNTGNTTKFFLSECQIQQGAGITIDVIGTCFAKINNNLFEEYNNANGAIKANFSSGTLKIFVHGNEFIHSTASNTPLKLWNSHPTKSIIHNNSYNTSVITDWTVTSGTNNISGI